ncbi:DUF1045 domain-containing protein [Ideonella sp. A 288]|uniref:DUF1045 domain-containing protein n=1 Tax=Ideonella sp. A 288 TaxID=1962181 RepID=UPI000B4A91E6|nr:DUF1045 domain-containing protein [Ideonella sp. A 288]
MTRAAPSRWAVYWVPEAGHPLWSAGCAWLGRDPAAAETGVAPPQRRAPWRYGFHATLKAPMWLRHGVTPEEFIAVVGRLARGHVDFDMPPLQVAWLGGFLALRPVTPVDEADPLRRLADDCVVALDGFRQPADPAEQAARAAALHSDDERALLERWGYAHVLSHWRLHLTLSDAVPEPAAALQAAARAHFAQALTRPLRARGVAVFEEPAPGLPLRLAARLSLRD